MFGTGCSTTGEAGGVCMEHLEQDGHFVIQTSTSSSKNKYLVTRHRTRKNVTVMSPFTVKSLKDNFNIKLFKY